LTWQHKQEPNSAQVHKILISNGKQFGYSQYHASHVNYYSYYTMENTHGRSRPIQIIVAYNFIAVIYYNNRLANH